MMSEMAQNPTDVLAGLIRAEHMMLAELGTVLEREFEAASTQADMSALLEEKLKVLEVLDRATIDRLKWQEDQGLPSHGDPLREAIADMDGSGMLSKLFAEFEQDARDLRERNRQLGQLNLRRQQSLQHALRVITNQSAEESNDYTAHGHSGAQQATRLLGSA